MSQSELTITLNNQYEEVERLAHVVEDFCTRNHVSEEMIYPLNVVLDEVVTNIIKYAWDDRSRHTLRADLKIQNHVFVAMVEDDGRPFNPIEVEDIDVTTSIEERQIGGLGLHFVKALMDTLEYKRSNQKNKLILKKKLTAEGERMDVDQEKAGEVFVFDVSGRVDAATCKNIEVELLGAIDEGRNRILADCSDLDYISSAGLRIFLLAAKKLKASNGKMVLCSLQPQIKTMFEIAGFSTAFPIVESRDDGMKMLNA